METALPVTENLVPPPRASHMLVSPLHELVTHLGTMNLLLSALTSRLTATEDPAEEKLVACPALIVCGDKYVFALPVDQVRAWVALDRFAEGQRGR